MSEKVVNHDQPSPDTLAGIYVEITGEEEVLVQPSQVRRPAPGPNGVPPGPDKIGDPEA